MWLAALWVLLGNATEVLWLIRSYLFISLKLQSQAGLDSSLAAAVDSNIWQWLGGIGRAARSEKWRAWKRISTKDVGEQNASHAIWISRRSKLWICRFCMFWRSYFLREFTGRNEALPSTSWFSDYSQYGFDYSTMDKEQSLSIWLVVTGFSEILTNKCAALKASLFVAFLHHPWNCVKSLLLRTHDVSGGAISAAFRLPGVILMKQCRREGVLHRWNWLNNII